MTFRSSPFPGSDTLRYGVADDAGRDLATLNYVLLILGFFTGVTAFVAVALALLRRGAATGVLRSHLDWQVRIVWHGVLALVAVAVLHAVVLGLGAITFGFGLVFMVIPWALGLAWLAWTVWAIVHGMRLLGRGAAVGRAYAFRR